MPTLGPPIPSGLGERVFATAPCGLSLYEAADGGRDFVLVDLNPAAEELQQVRRAEALGRRLTELVPGVGELGLLDVFRRVWESGRAEDHPFGFREDGRISGWRGTTVFKLETGQLCAVNERSPHTRLLLDSLFGFVGIYTKEGILIEANRAPLVAAGLERGDVVGKPFWETYWWSHSAATREQVRRALERAAAGETVREDFSVRVGPAETIVIDASFGPLRDPSGRITQLIGFGVDVTDRKRTEEQLRRSQKMDVVGELAGGIAHDFNNMLTVILSHASQLADALPEDDPKRSHVERIFMAAERSAALTRQLLTLGRRQVAKPRVLDLNTVIREMELVLRRVLGEAIELDLVLAQDLGSVHADPAQIEQLIVNLVLNARDAIRPPGRVTVETANVSASGHGSGARPELPSERSVMLRVSDDGVGMDESTLQRIFEPFFTTKEEGGGTGLGLATVYGTVQQSAGTIHVDSEPGAGSAFTVHLPRVEGATEAAFPPAGPAAEAFREEGTILIVEDEELVRTILRRTLEAHGYRVVEAESGETALRLHAELAAVDLVVADVVMPRVSGPQLVERLRTRQPSLKALFISGYPERRVAHQGRLDPGIRFLSKPFNERDLLLEVRGALAARAES